MQQLDADVLLGDRYRLVRMIGSGGMGTVWEAEDETLGRPVAVKVLSESLAAGEHAVRRFEREAQAAARLSGPYIAAVYDFLVTTFHVWSEFVDFQFLARVRALAERARVVASFDAVAFILGLGYVMGLRASLLLCAGGFTANFVLVPLIWMIGRNAPDLVVYPGTLPIAEMTAGQIFRGYVRFMGVGAIATAGIFGIVKSLKVVVGSFSIAARAFRHGETMSVERTDRDIPVTWILGGVLVSTLAAGVFFASLRASLVVVLVGLLLTLAFSFFFTSVAANAIATSLLGHRRLVLAGMDAERKAARERWRRQATRYVQILDEQRPRVDRPVVQTVEGEGERKFG